MIRTLEKPVTVEAYLELEEQSEIRHEFVDGEMVAMAGETGEHEDIVFNIVAALRPIAQAKGCRLRGPSVKLRVSGQRYRYPDVYVVCEPQGNDPRLEENPCFIIEVLSPSTVETDRITKLDEYTNIPSLQRYVLIEQDRRFVIVYQRTPEGWLYQTFQDGMIDVPCLETTLALDQIYAGIELSETVDSVSENEKPSS
jgi:Uma2 family endonuclease